MSNDNHGHTLVGKLSDKVENLSYHLGVECGGGLVEEHNLGIHSECSDNSDTLLLSTGESGRVYVRLLLKTDSFKKCVRLLAHLSLDLRHGGIRLNKRLLILGKKVGEADEEILALLLAELLYTDVHGRHHYVFNNGLIVKEIKLLENHTDVFSVLVNVDTHICDVVAIEVDGAACGVLHTVKTTKESRLTRAGCTENNHLLTLGYIEIDAAQNRIAILKDLFKSLYANNVFTGHLRSLLCVFLCFGVSVSSVSIALGEGFFEYFDK